MTDEREALVRRIDAERERLVGFFRDFVRLYGVDPARVTVVPNAVDPRLVEALRRDLAQ